MKFNIQLFSVDDQWYSQPEQEALLAGVKSGLDSVTSGTDMLASTISWLSENWHSKDADNTGNKVVESLKKFIPASREYVSSISGWMAAHGKNIAAINGNEVSFSQANAETGISINNFYDDPNRRGLTSTKTASMTKSKLLESLETITQGIKTTTNAVNNNTNAMPQGVVPNDLIPTVEAENAKINARYEELNTNLSSMLEKLSNAISEESARAGSDAQGQTGTK